MLSESKGVALEAAGSFVFGFGGPKNSDGCVMRRYYSGSITTVATVADDKQQGG